MQQNHQFIESLIGLKKHYQSLQEEIEREKFHAKEQLNHVNFLLVEQLAVENQQFIESLIGLRNHYQGVNSECERKASQAREQLIHINALLADQLLQHDQPVSIKASTVNEKKALTEAAGGNEESRTAEDKLDLLDEPVEVSEASEPSKVEEVDEPNELEEPTSPTTDAAVVQSDSEPTPDSSVNSQAPRLRPLKTPMLPKYQQMTKLQAVESLLQESAGTILHVDYIIRAVHGELDANDKRAEKDRMHQTLSEGALKGLWDKVPGKPGCYTIDLKLVDPDLAAKNQQRKIGRRPKYQSRSSAGFSRQASKR